VTLNEIKLKYKGNFYANGHQRLKKPIPQTSQKQVISVGGNAMMTSVVGEQGAFMKQGTK
jgi:hypothetical protein